MKNSRCMSEKKCNHGGTIDWYVSCFVIWVVPCYHEVTLRYFCIMLSIAMLSLFIFAAYQFEIICVVHCSKYCSKVAYLHHFTKACLRSCSDKHSKFNNKFRKNLTSTLDNTILLDIFSEWIVCGDKFKLLWGLTCI